MEPGKGIKASAFIEVSDELIEDFRGTYTLAELRDMLDEVYVVWESLKSETKAKVTIVSTAGDLTEGGETEWVSWHPPEPTN